MRNNLTLGLCAAGLLAISLFAFTLASLRAGLLAFIEHPERWSAPTGDLRLYVAAAFPALYVAGGELAPPPTK